MSKEMLAAGLDRRGRRDQRQPKARARRSATPASTPPTPHRKRRAASLSSATKLGALIAEAVADAAQRVMSGKWSMEASAAAHASGVERAQPVARNPAQAQDRRAQALDRAREVARRKHATRRARNRPPRAPSRSATRKSAAKRSTAKRATRRCEIVAQRCETAQHQPHASDAHARRERARPRGGGAAAAAGGNA